MKQYLTFFGMNYYPRGGMNDLVKDFDDQSKAIAYLKRKIAKEPYCWGHVYDTKKRTIVWESENYL